MDFTDVMGRVALLYVPFLFALCFHEYAHGWVAKKLGDPTAELMGRLTLNPLAHMDILGTVVFPLLAIVGSSPLFFGWAKPVPVVVSNLKNPKNDMFWVALAGPASNFLLAIVGFLIMGLRHKLPLPEGVAQVLPQLLQMFILLNLFLCIFNLIPVHPLDGGKILARFLPYSVNKWLEDNSGTISMLLFLFIIFDGLGGGGLKIVSAPVYFLYNILEVSVGQLFLFS